MAKYKTDHRDIYFNLFDLLQVDQKSSDMSADELKGIIEEYDRYVANEIYTCRENGDQVGVKLNQGKVKVPQSFEKATRGFYENGWFALGLPEEFGGVPVPHAVSIACASLSTGANTAWMMYPGLAKAALNLILERASAEQRQLYAPPMIAGQFGGTMCLTEPNAGSDLGEIKTTAKPIGNGLYSISGSKIFISSGDSQLFENIVHLVLARTPGAPSGTSGLSLFIVPKYRVEADGSIGAFNDVSCSKIEEKMGLHAQATCELLFGANQDCQGQLIGQEGEGIKHMFVMMNEARLGTGLQGEAQSNLAYMLTEQYVRERSQFGKNIVEHPDVKKNMLKIRAMSRGMRALCLYAANLFDQGEEGEAEVGLLTPVCKAYCTDEAMKTTTDAVQMHGGYGYCSEYGVEQFMRDTKIAAIYEGTNGIQAIDFVMRKILRDQGQTLQKLGAKIQSSLANGCESWPEETKLMASSLSKSVEIVGHFAKQAQSNAIDEVLTYCCEFLEFSGHLITAWRLLESAKRAEDLLKSGASGDEKAFLDSKITDFKVFCHFYLRKNISLGKTILEPSFKLADHSY
ncbi:MAG: acyl-CoA dehydrogenase [Oligoflexus sp.]